MAPPLSKNLDSQATGITGEGSSTTDGPVQDRWQTIAPSSSTSKKTAPALEPFGDYELLAEIARGGMGVVYKARQRGLERTVALKMILSGPNATEEDVQRFCLEARAAANLDHPNIVQVYEIGQHENQHYFSMAFIEGDSLAGMIKGKGVTLSFPEAALTLQALADAIQYAHEHGIIHRDLKPENVLVDKQGRPRITDFGLAKRLEVDNNLTASGQIMGTPSYMAPEQAQGKPTTSAVDVYALGAILYFLLTRRPPFAGKNLMETLVQVAEKPPVPPRQVNPSVPAELEAICLKCLQKDPAKRYASAGALAADLNAWVSVAGAGLSSTQPLANKVRALLASGSGTEPTGQVPATVITATKGKRSFAGWVAGAVVLACVVGIGLTAYFRGGLFGSTGPVKEKEGPVASSLDETPAPQVIQSKGFTRPEKQRRRDFDFKVTLNGGTPGPTGEYSLPAGENLVSFTVEMNRDAYLRIWAIDDADGEITMLFPNKNEADTLFKAGKTYTIGQKASFITQPSTAQEHYWVMASTQPWTSLKGQTADLFEVFSTPEQKKQWEQELSRVASATRKTLVGRVNAGNPGEPVPETEAAIAEEVFAYRVKANK